jgi:hypothetical protein
VDQQTLLQRLLDILQGAKLRPAMYFGHAEPGAASTFLAGFSSAAGTALGWDWERRFDVRKKVAVGRGWKSTSTGPVHQMEAKGLPAGKIVTELIEIEAEFIRQMTEPTKADSQ